MSQPIIQAFVTTADDSGAKKISAALKGVKSDMRDVEEQAGKTIEKVDGFGKFNERVASRFVFRELAQSAVGAADSVNSVKSASEAAFVGLELLGRSVIGFAGPLGIAALGIAAFVEIITKLQNKSVQTAESIKKETTELVNNSIAASNSAKDLQKLGVITGETAKALNEYSGQQKEAALSTIKKIAADTDAQIVETKRQLALATQVETAKKTTTETKNLDSATMAYVQASKQADNQDGKRKKTTDDLNAQLNKLTATSEAAHNILDQKDKSKDAEYQITLNKILIDQATTLQAKQHQFTDLKNAERTAQEEVNDAQTAYIKALRLGDEAAILSANKRLEAAQSMKNGITTALKTVESEDQKLATEIQKYSDAIAGSWEWQNDRLVFSTAKASAQIVSIVGKQISTELIMAGTRDLLDPLKPPGLGLAEIAAGASVAALSGGVSAALAGPGGGGSSVASPSGGANAPASGSGTQNFTNLLVKIEGGYFDDKAGQNLAKKLSELVQTQNVRLVSSTVQPAFGIKP